LTTLAAGEGRRFAAARTVSSGGGEAFDLLEALLRENDSYAARMKSRYAETGCIMDCISGQYSY
jgi:hypothetical protein